MAAQPKAFGRWLPYGDFEGDDFTPGAGGKYVTCGDTALGRDIAYATNGRIDKDGSVYRAAIIPRDPDGVTLDQLATAAQSVAHVTLIQPQHWDYPAAKAHLALGKGLLVGGWYAAFDRAYRYQAFADFGHFIWISHWSPTSAAYRVWDPLNPDIHAWGRWIPEAQVRRFMESGHGFNYYCGYVPLQPL